MHFHPMELNDPHMKNITIPLYKANAELLTQSADDQMSDNPKIAGTFNSWKFERMYSLKEACSIVDRYKTLEPPEALSKPEYKRSKKEEKLIEQYEEQIDTKYRKFWYKVFDESLAYTPFYENYPYEYSASEDTFVYINYLRPSKHDYVVLESTETK